MVPEQLPIYTQSFFQRMSQEYGAEITGPVSLFIECGSRQPVMLDQSQLLDRSMELAVPQRNDWSITDNGTLVLICAFEAEL